MEDEDNHEDDNDEDDDDDIQRYEDKRQTALMGSLVTILELHACNCQRLQFTLEYWQLVRHSNYVEEIYSEGKTKESIRFWRLAFRSKGEEIYDIKKVSP